MGYQVISVSGGEPFLYSGLLEVLLQAKQLGLRTAVTTNGYFLQPQRLEILREGIDILAVSLDGPPDLHNRLRGSPQAFDRLCSGLEHLRASGMHFGFIHTLTCDTWDNLVWIAEFAVQQGARLLQLHPLEKAGRADPSLSPLTARDNDLSRAYLMAFAMAAKYKDSMAIHVDLLHRQQLIDNPALAYSNELPESWMNAPAADLLGVLVLEPDGTVVPISYGFARRYKICNVTEQRLRDGWEHFVRTGYLEFRDLCNKVFEELISCEDQQLFNWYERMVARSHLCSGVVDMPSRAIFTASI
jgi:MoaA/NifB/PqqE/SkfB family radical SAM enzyme